MTYILDSKDVPDEVGIGDSFSPSARICCETDRPDEISECEEKDIEIFIESIEVRGIFGIWSFPLLNSILNDKEEQLHSGTINLDSGSCQEYSEEVTISTPGHYKFVVMVQRDRLVDETFEVKE